MRDLSRGALSCLTPHGSSMELWLDGIATGAGGDAPSGSRKVGMGGVQCESPVSSWGWWLLVMR